MAAMGFFLITDTINSEEIKLLDVCKINVAINEEVVPLNVEENKSISVTKKTY